MKVSSGIMSEEDFISLLVEYSYSDTQMPALLERFENGESFEVYNQGILYDEDDDDDY